MADAPLRDVVEVIDLKGPRGGTILVMHLSCGHALWRRVKRPPMQTRCVTCWLIENHPDAFQRATR
jgi:hypothetical protein